MKTCIIAVNYTEPDYQQTKDCLLKCDVPLFFVHRNGIGSLAKAYNDGFNTFNRFGREFDYVWFVSNVVFIPDILPRLISRMESSGYAAIHPSFDNSDHLFCRSNGTDDLTVVPFVEFTAPIVRSSVFHQIQLDEDMPYWGHDLDWGYRVRKAGYSIGVDNGCKIEHTYNRDLTEEWPDTLARKALRKNTDRQTVYKLEKKYGPEWKRILRYVS